MTKEQEDKLIAWLKPKSAVYLVKVLLFLELEANHNFSEYRNIVAVVNQLLLERTSPK
jgi:hypothetical protein